MTAVILDREKTVKLKTDFEQLFGERGQKEFDQLLIEYRAVVAGSWPLQYFVPGAKETWNADVDIWLSPQAVGKFMSFFYEHGYQPFVKIKNLETDDANDYTRLRDWVTSVYSSIKKGGLSPTIQLIVVSYPMVNLYFAINRQAFYIHLNLNLIVDHQTGSINKHLIVQQLRAGIIAKIKSDELRPSVNLINNKILIDSAFPIKQINEQKVAFMEKIRFEEIALRADDGFEPDCGEHLCKYRGELVLEEEKMLNYCKHAVEAFDLEICQLFYDGQNIQGINNCDLKTEFDLIYGNLADYRGELEKIGVKLSYGDSASEAQVLEGLEKIPAYILNMSIQGQLRTRKTKISFMAKYSQSVYEWLRTLRRIQKYVKRGFEVSIAKNLLTWMHLENVEEHFDFAEHWNRIAGEINQFKNAPDPPGRQGDRLNAREDIPLLVSTGEEFELVYNKVKKYDVMEFQNPSALVKQRFHVNVKPYPENLEIPGYHVAIFLDENKYEIIHLNKFVDIVKKQPYFSLSLWRTDRAHKKIPRTHLGYLNFAESPLLEKIARFQKKYKKIYRYCQKLNPHDVDEMMCTSVTKIPDYKLIEQAAVEAKEIFTELDQKIPAVTQVKTQKLSIYKNLPAIYARFFSDEKEITIGTFNKIKQEIPGLPRPFVLAYNQVAKSWSQTIAKFIAYKDDPKIENLPYKLRRDFVPSEEFKHHAEEIANMRKNFADTQMDLVNLTDAQLAQIEFIIKCAQVCITAESEQETEKSYRLMSKIHLQYADSPEDEPNNFFRELLKIICTLIKNSKLIARKPRFTIITHSLDLILSIKELRDRYLKPIPRPNLESLTVDKRSPSWWHKVVSGMKYLFLISVEISDKLPRNNLDDENDDPEIEHVPEKYKNYWVRNNKYLYDFDGKFQMNFSDIYKLIFAFQNNNINKFYLDVIKKKRKIATKFATNLYSRKEQKLPIYYLTIIQNEDLPQLILEPTTEEPLKYAVSHVLNYCFEKSVHPEQVKELVEMVVKRDWADHASLVYPHFKLFDPLGYDDLSSEQKEQFMDAMVNLIAEPVYTQLNL